MSSLLQTLPGAFHNMRPPQCLQHQQICPPPSDHLQLHLVYSALDVQNVLLEQICSHATYTVRSTQSDGTSWLPCSTPHYTHRHLFTIFCILLSIAFLMLASIRGLVSDPLDYLKHDFLLTLNSWQHHHHAGVGKHTGSSGQDVVEAAALYKTWLGFQE